MRACSRLLAACCVLGSRSGPLAVDCLQAGARLGASPCLHPHAGWPSSTQDLSTASLCLAPILTRTPHPARAWLLLPWPVSAGNFFILMIPKGASKGSAARHVSKRLGFSPDRVMVAGVSRYPGALLPPGFVMAPYAICAVCRDPCCCLSGSRHTDPRTPAAAPPAACLPASHPASHHAFWLPEGQGLCVLFF